MVETVTKEELEQVRSSGGRICFTLCTDEDLKKFTAVKKHLEERKAIETNVDVVRELLDFYIRRSPSYNF